MTELTSLLAIVALSSSTSILAQTAAQYTVPGVKTQITHDIRTPSAYGTYVVTNETNIPIVALRFSYGCGSLKQTPTFDTLVEYGGYLPIMPGKTWTARWNSQEVLKCPGGVDAAIFADGRVEGSPKGLAEIYGRRRGAWEAINFAIPLLEKVIETDSQQPETLITLSKKEWEQPNYKIKMRPGEFMGRNFVLGIVADSLVGQTHFLVPSDLSPHREPGINEVMRDQNLSRTQATAYVLRRQLLEWKRDLDGNLGPE